MTTPERWKEIDRIFAAALELEPAERPPFLSEACGSDADLRKEVDSLLANDIAESLGGEAVGAATRLLEKKAEEPTIYRIGRYQIVRSLGAGGMGRVYLGLDEQLNRPVAVKLLSNYNASEAERMLRFRREALAASALNHPNILTIYEIGEFEGANFITAEFVDGVTLRARIKAGTVPTDLALDIGIQIASALAAAHAAGIVHRDIKSENVMVRADGLVKVLDFGIAKFTQAENSEARDIVETMPGAIIGTAAYMSPEQARGELIDTRSDIWSLGVILYEMIARRPPFSGNTPADVLAAVLEREPPPLPTHSSAALESLERIVLKALQKERGKRYQTAGELLTDLKQLRQSSEIIKGGERLTSSKAPASQEELAELPLNPKTVKSPPELTSGEGGTTRSSAEYIVDRIKHYKYTVLVVLVLLVAVAALFGYRSLFSNKIRPIESIAVMPFVNESGNGEVEYLSDGIADTLITSLSQLPQLSVKARSSAFRYKGKETTAQQVGKELNVQAILNGRVVQRGNNLTLHIELVDVNTETALWSADYNRSMTNLVSLPGEIASDVSSKLRLKLSGADQQKLAKNYTANTEAYQLYLKGRYHVFKLTPPEIQTGISYLQQAIEIDPAYALAYVGLSEAYRSLALGAEMTPSEFLPRGKAAAQKAIDIDDALAEAHTALGACIFWYDWNWTAAEDQYKRALVLNPNSVDTHLFYAHLLSNTGRHAEGLEEIKRARELDPISPFVGALEGQFLLHAGRTDEALDRLQKTFDLAPGFWLPHVFASSAYIEKGMYREADAEAQRAKELSPNQTISIAYGSCALAKWGKRAEAQAALDSLLNRAKQRFVPATHIALIYNALGETDQALAWLEKGYEQRDAKMAFLKVEPKWNNLRNDPRFQDLMKRVGF